MSEQTTGLVPKLRFPEFREAGEWEVKKLGDKNISVFVKQRTPLTKLEIETYVSTENILPDFNGITTASKLPPSGSFTEYKKNDILIANIRPYLKKIWVADRTGGASNDVVVVRPSSNTRNAFLSSYLKGDHFISYIMKGAKGVKMPRGDVSLMKEYPIAIPQLAEQQKIAACLSSLDALITAQADKLAALKIHKKGLMQQLFPREGETVPRLRFPEFREAGEWIKHFLIDTASEKLSNGVFNDPDKVGRGCKLINVIDMYIEPYIDEERLSLLDIGKSDLMRNKVISGDIFFTRSSLVKEGIAQSNIYLGSAEDITFDGHLVRLRPNKNIVIYLYLHYALKSNFARSQLISKGKTATMTTIGQSDIADTIVWIPKKEEQQKIASCLSSLDALIAAQSGKLDALKTHKKGLMQQLFPRETREIPAPVHRDQEPNPLKGSVTFEKDILSPIGDTWDADR